MPVKVIDALNYTFNFLGFLRDEVPQRFLFLFIHFSLWMSTAIAGPVDTIQHYSLSAKYSSSNRSSELTSCYTV
ncbi:hypothetical protein I7I53_04301 [Histoplasma capsulatum var. duboisii H88]|uniref:Uncharacterized protein n=1 Tax=Ajellomyces capsulatus (strain H88) TaxID=544711 RepID=A0A8A1LW37_AJEC8|nr:hypothetical protein I7I53_04301 [Histoplasma capsulatum var. duboisii H88]